MFLTNVFGSTKKSITDPFETDDIFPDEVWVHIFSFIPHNFLPTLSLVCRKWCQLSSDDLLWKPLFYKDFYNSIAINKKLSFKDLCQL